MLISRLAGREETQINPPTIMSTIKILQDGNIHVHVHLLALEAGHRPTPTYPTILPEVDHIHVQFLQRRNVGVETQAL